MTTRIITETYRNSVKYTISIYNKVVLVEISPSQRTKHSTIRKNHVVFSKTYFNAMLRQHRNMAWILDIKDPHRVVTPEYYTFYTDGENYRSNFDGPYCPINPSHLLDEGHFYLIVRDNTYSDYNFYDLKNRPVLRSIWVDYIRSRIRGSRKEMLKLETKLKKHEQVSHVTKIEIPYYNADWSGQQTVEFFFHPTPRQFALWAHNTSMLGDSYKRICKLVLGKKR